MTGRDTSNDIMMSGVDQFLPIDKAQFSLFDMARSAIDKSIESASLLPVTQFAQSLLGLSRISGIAFAQFIYELRFAWSKITNIDFYGWADEALGTSKITVDRNYRVWEMLVSGDVPGHVVEKLKTMPIRCLIPISNAWSQKYSISDKQWGKLAEAPDLTTVSKLVREIKKKQPKKDAINIVWERDNKRLIGWKDSEPHYINLMYDESDPVSIAVLERLTSGKALEE